MLVEETRAYHREYINSQRPDPKIYAVGDTVFARHAVKSVASRELVGKLQYAYTGPWQVTKALDGASYEITHLRHANKKDKKHASDLSPYPIELIAVEPLDGADNQYGQLLSQFQLSNLMMLGSQDSFLLTHFVRMMRMCHPIILCHKTNFIGQRCQS